jgi:integrase
MPFPIHPHMLRHACGFKLANDGHDTRALCTTSATGTSSIRPGTPRWRPTVSRTFGEAIE